MIKALRNGMGMIELKQVADFQMFHQYYVVNHIVLILFMAILLVNYF